MLLICCGKRLAQRVFLLRTNRTQVWCFFEVTNRYLVLLLLISPLQWLVHLDLLAEHRSTCIVLCTVSECQELKIIALYTIWIRKVYFLFFEFHQQPFLNIKFQNLSIILLLHFIIIQLLLHNNPFKVYNNLFTYPYFIKIQFLFYLHHAHINFSRKV